MDSRQDYVPATARRLPRARFPMNDQPRRAHGLVIHPLLFAAIPPLFFYAHNSRSVAINPLDVLPFVAASMLLAGVVWALAFAGLRDARRSGLVASAFIALFFLYGHVFMLVQQAWAGLKHLHLGVLFLLVFGLAVLGVARIRRPLGPFTLVLNIVGLVMLVVNLVSGVPGVARWVRYQQRAPRNVTAATHDYPDIYYIIPDAYGRSDVLEDIYDYDNSQFIESLRQRGFRVAEHSRANYMQTFLSLGSSLNMCYLDSLSAAAGDSSGDRSYGVDFLQHNRLMPLLRRAGYKIVAFSTGYHETEFRQADVYFTPRWLPGEFQNILLSTTPVPPLLDLFGRKDLFDLHRQRVNYVLDHVSDASRVAGPVFVFVHLAIPHTPYVFGANGEPYQPDPLFNLSSGSHLHNMEPELVAKCVREYRAQITYTTSRLSRLVDDILARSPEPPIIVLQSDHGPDSRLHWEEARWTDFGERMPILNAYYFPDHDYDAISDSISPVNTFRVICNKLFDSGYPLLENRSYYSTAARPYGFIDVDRYHPEPIDVPERVSAVVFRDGAAVVPGHDSYARRLVSSQYPGAGVGNVFLLSATPLPSVEDALKRYHQEVEASRLPPLGEPVRTYQGMDPYWAPAVILLFDDAVPRGNSATVPGRINLVVFRCSDTPPSRPELFERGLVAGRFPGARPGKMFIAPLDAPLSVEESLRRYRLAVAEGRIPDLGEEYQSYEGLDPDSCGVTVLFFPERSGTPADN